MQDNIVGVGKSVFKYESPSWKFVTAKADFVWLCGGQKWKKNIMT